MCRADQRAANNYHLAMTITKSMRMKTKERNEGRRFHITGRKSVRNLKKNVIFEQFAWSN
jgi:hypothetical protein